jgi:hypothetical protein
MDRIGVMLMAAAAALLAVAVASCGGDSEGDVTPGDGDGIIVVLPSPTEKPTPAPRKTSTPTPTPSPTPLAVCGTNPDPVSPKLVQVEEPKAEARLSLPIRVRGWGSTIGFKDEGVAIAVLDARQAVLQVLDVPPQPREFRVVPVGIEITEYTRPFAADILMDPVLEPTPLCLWIYQETTAEGIPKGVLQIPIVLLP